jgi:DNA-binding NarL/FixJ family response regulator
VYVREAFARGARGYVLKEASDEELADAIHEVLAGNEYVSSSLGARLVAAQRKKEREGLTDREREVLRLIALGHTNQEIAGRLFVSVRTAEAHRAHIMNKLRFQTRAQLVRYALESGVVRKDDLD